MGGAGPLGRGRASWREEAGQGLWDGAGRLVAGNEPLTLWPGSGAAVAVRLRQWQRRPVFAAFGKRLRWRAQLHLQPQSPPWLRLWSSSGTWRRSCGCSCLECGSAKPRRPPRSLIERCSGEDSETQKFCEQVHAAIKTFIAVYYLLPKDQGITLRKLVRGATLDIVDGMAQLMEVLSVTPTQSPENNDLISYNSVWVACQQMPQIPRDNKAAALLMLTKNVDFVKDAHEEMEQAVEECDPYSGLLNDTEENNSDNHNHEDDVLGFPSNQDLYWSEDDQELIIPCLALVRASKACLKKIRMLVAENGKKDQVAQLDDIVDISDEISPSVDDLALSIYPPMCHLTVRINSAKLVSVLKKALEITKASHVTPQPEDSWIPLLINAIDHCLNRIKELTQSELEL
ncbi:cyclin-D1-binding protein 1 isoform X1 [Pan troglodytes]|uniref:cyclin-D1-binding protein 1 isoform X1 n=1 Tax=Pan troglodytes TaxID=9598 RepID=UPI0000E23C33|nr:cyclin-D1-binding protein 1 isoform X1 [Pan troglodytes]